MSIAIAFACIFRLRNFLHWNSSAWECLNFRVWHSTNWQTHDDNFQFSNLISAACVPCVHGRFDKNEKFGNNTLTKRRWHIAISERLRVRPADKIHSECSVCLSVNRQAVWCISRTLLNLYILFSIVLSQKYVSSSFNGNGNGNAATSFKNILN